SQHKFVVFGEKQRVRRDGDRSQSDRAQESCRERRRVMKQEQDPVEALHASALKGICRPVDQFPNLAISEEVLVKEHRHNVAAAFVKITVNEVLGDVELLRDGGNATHHSRSEI